MGVKRHVTVVDIYNVVKKTREKTGSKFLGARNWNYMVMETLI